VAPEFSQVTLEAFRRHVLLGQSVEETARQLDISKASVYQAKSRILHRVKERLELLDPEADV
jgi:DNA-directed RNA polymerase specialized sigma24 family protein